MQFTKGNFISLRATTKIHLGQLGEDVQENDIIAFDGQTIKIGGHSHQLSALKGAIKAGWFVETSDTTSRYTPKPSGVRIKTSLTQEDDGSDRAEMPVQTIADEERVVGTVQTLAQRNLAQRNKELKATSAQEAQEAVSVGTIKTPAKQSVNLADTQAVQKELSRLERPSPPIGLLKVAKATGDVEEAIVADTLEELLPNAAKPARLTQESSELNWDLKAHWKTRVKNAVSLHETNPQQFEKVLNLETKSVRKRIEAALN